VTARAGTAGPTGRNGRRVLLAGTLGAAILAIFLWTRPATLGPGGSGAAPVPAANPDAAGAGAPGTVVAATWQRPSISASALADRLGVEISQVALTGGGGLLDLRVLILNADLAAALHDRSMPPALVDQATGVVASDLLMGHAHNDPFKTGLTYYFVFENPGSVIQRGGEVSVLLGNAEVDHIEVR
jgi:hypothetical protein